MSSNIAEQRIHFLDNLRAIAMLLGVVFHAAMAYTPLLKTVLPTAGPEQSVALDVFAWFTHLWRMPLFFLVSGFFAVLLIHLRGVGGFLKNRALRIAAPLIVFLPVVTLMFIASIGWALESVEHPSIMLAQIRVMIAEGTATPPPASTAHLWFLFNLCLFCLTVVPLVKLNVLEGRWANRMLEPKWLLTLAPLLIFPALASQQTPHPAPEKLYPELWSFGFYGVFFLVGGLLYGRLEALNQYERLTTPLFVVSCLLFVVIYQAISSETLTPDQILASGHVVMSYTHLLTTLLSSVVAVYVTVCCLVWGRKLLAFKNTAMRYIADASYWIYIVHLPIIFTAQYIMLDVDWGVWPEFLISTAAGFGIGLVTYALFVRWTPIGLLLNGRRVPLRQKPKGVRWDQPQ